MINQRGTTMTNTLETETHTMRAIVQDAYGSADVLRLASDLVIDAVVEPEELRAEVVARLAAAGRRGA